MTQATCGRLLLRSGCTAGGSVCKLGTAIGRTLVALAPSAGSTHGTNRLRNIPSTMVYHLMSKNAVPRGCLGVHEDVRPTDRPTSTELHRPSGGTFAMTPWRPRCAWAMWCCSRGFSEASMVAGEVDALREC